MKTVKAGVDIVMPDNFSPKQAEAACEMLKKAGFGDVLVELSGGIAGETLLDYAQRRWHYKHWEVDSQR